MDTNYDNKTLLCRADYKGKAIPGRISFSPEEVSVKLVGFEDFVYFKDQECIPLQLEDNQFCTAIPFATSPGTTSSAADRCHSLRFRSRQVILGFRPWGDDDRVKEFHFGLSDVNGLFDAPDIKKKIAASQIGDQPDTVIIEGSSSGSTVTISYSYTFDWHGDNYRAAEPSGCVKFEEPKSIDEVSEFVAIIRTFLTMAAGIEVTTRDYWIVPEKNHEQPLLGGGAAPASFRLIWPTGTKVQLDEANGMRPTSVLRCFGEDDRLSTSKCLSSWMQNWASWKPAFLGLLIATREGNTFDTDRILNACKWLESTPGTKQQKLGIQKELADIASAAIGKASDLGLDLSDRIQGAIKRLGTESRNELFIRLIDSAVAKDDAQLKKRFLADLHKAFYLRGGFAHSKFDYASDDEFDDYVRCTKAVEALSFLLLYRNLPLPADHHWGHGPNNFTDYLTMSS